MIRVQAPSRLHFGVLNLAAYGPWPDLDGDPTVPVRRFGGAGLMIDTPGTIVRVEPAADWSADGPLAERALAVAKRFTESVPHLGPHRVTVERAAPEHVGLGTGTQLALAVAKALAVAAGMPDAPAEDLARRVGRGARSGVGVHGFRHGGFVVEGGRADGDGVAPLLTRLAFPEEWRVVLVRPVADAGTHGAAEHRFFAQPPARRVDTDALCRVLLLGVLPALADRDFEAFGDALTDFNARSGELFADGQGGRYAGPAVADAVRRLRALGARGVGQSSWGPTAFGVASDAARAQWLRDRVRAGLPSAAAEVVAADNRGGREPG